MTSRKAVLEFINNLIIDNQGTESVEATIVRQSGIDSFGYAILFLELDDEYGCFSNEYTKSISAKEAETMTIKMLIDRVVECS